MPADNPDEIRAKVEIAKKAAQLILDARRRSFDLPDDSLAEDEEKAYKRIVNLGLQQDIDERRKYGNRFYGLALTWILIIALTLALQGFGLFSFKLSEPVLLAVIGSTTVNILGLLYVVANYLFPKH